MTIIRNTLHGALLAAGKELKKGSLQKKKISFKTPISLVTQTDMKAERAVLKIIKKKFPAHSILAEESGLEKKRVLTNGLLTL